MIGNICPNLPTAGINPPGTRSGGLGPRHMCFVTYGESAKLARQLHRHLPDRPRWAQGGHLQHAGVTRRSQVRDQLRSDLGGRDRPQSVESSRHHWPAFRPAARRAARVGRRHRSRRSSRGGLEEMTRNSSATPRSSLRIRCSRPAGISIAWRSRTTLSAPASSTVPVPSRMKYS